LWERTVLDERANIVAFLRADFRAEAEAGFPRLRRSPQTKIIQLIDYFGSLSTDDQSDLLGVLALRGSALVDPNPTRLPPSAPAFDRYWKTVTSPGPFSGGYRYCDVKTLAAIPRMAEFGSYADWIEQTQRPWISERALEPRQDLLPSLECLTPARGPGLRKLVKAALQARGFTAERGKGSEHQYVSPAGAIVRVDFGSYLGQLVYHVSAACGATRIVRLSYESLWSQPGGWDYLTDENAARSVEHLAGLVEYLIHLPERINRQAKRD
jgi:hypothetical protein